MQLHVLETEHNHIEETIYVPHYIIALWNGGPRGRNVGSDAVAAGTVVDESGGVADCSAELVHRAGN
jgi:hypothetical protein